MRRLNPNVTTKGMRVTIAVQANCRHCGEQAEVYESGLFRCKSKPCIRDGRCKVFTPNRRREPEVYALWLAHQEGSHAGKNNGTGRKKKVLERTPPLKRACRSASAGARA